MSIDGTERRRELLKALRATVAAAPLTIKSLAELLHVSVRTVHYDLDILAISRNTLLADLKDVQELIEGRGLAYESKRGAGISISGPEQVIRDMYIHIFAEADYDFRTGASLPLPIQTRQEPFRDYTEGLPVKKIAARFIAIMKKITGSDDVAFGHFGTVGYIFAAYVGKWLGNKEHTTEEINFPKGLYFLRDSSIAISLVILVLFLVVALACGILITFLPVFLMPVLGNLGFANTTFSDADFCIVGTILGNVINLIK